MPLPHSYKWTFTLLDNKYVVADGELEKIQGDLPPEDLEESGERGVYAKISIPSRVRPKIQWVRNEEEELTFTATFVNDGTVVGEAHAKSRAQRMRTIIKRAARPIYGLGRPPKYYFNYGPNLAHICFIRQVSSLRYSTVMNDEGNSIMITLEVALELLFEDTSDVPALSAESSSPPQSPREGLTIRVKKGDTWETIAAERYKSPEAGIVARQESKLAFPGSGADAEVAERTVELPDLTFLTRTGVSPRAPALQMTRGDVEESFNVVFAKRLAGPK